MPCYNPVAGFRSKEVNPDTGKFLVFVNTGDRIYPGMDYFAVPCGKCVGCRLERSRQWSVRCLHESKCWKDNCFITLTFDDKSLPPGGSLVPHSADFQLFMKRLRRRFYSGIRFFHCGEYGSLLRPHHHACLFNFDFPDKVLWQVKAGTRLYRSKILEELWPFGFCTVGDVTAESAAYVAQYVVKKINKSNSNFYKDKVRDYITMSRRPGIGLKWLEKFSSDVYPHDFVVVNGFKAKPPRFYDSKYCLTNPDDFASLKDKRIEAAKSNPNNTYSRLKVREVVAEAAVANLRRSL